MSNALYLIRHAEAEPAGPGGDRDRALTAQGRHRFAALLESARAEMAVSRVVTSPYLRARQTAQLVAEAFGVPVEEELALASGESEASSVLALARRLGPGCALVGHNPEISEAVSAVARRGMAVAPGTIVTVELAEGGSALRWIRSP